MRNLANSHTLRRQEHIESLRELVRQVEDNIARVASHGDLVLIEDTIMAYKKRMEEAEAELKGKDNRISGHHHEAFNQRLDVDTNRRARSDFETSNKNLADMRAS